MPPRSSFRHRGGLRRAGTGSPGERPACPRPARWSWLGLPRQDSDHISHGGDLAVTAADQVRDHTRPAGLMGGTEAGRVVAVEVLAEHEVVLPCGVVLHALHPP